MKSVDVFDDELSDAYSWNRYRNGWKPCIKMLRRRGYNDDEIEAILRSKWTRWAADNSTNRYGYNTAKDLAHFLDSWKDQDELAKDIQDLVKGRF